MFVAVTLALLLAACASGGSSPEWTGVPADEPPAAAERPRWLVYWDDRERGWRRTDGGQPLRAAQLPADAWTYEQDAVAVRIFADEQLNTSRGSAHTVAVHVLQTRKPGRLLRRLEYPADAYRLLALGAEDPDVLALDRLIIGPGREALLRVDRAEQARHLLLVVGYAEYSRGGAVRSIEVPGVRDVPRGRARLAPGNLIDAVNPFTPGPAPRPGRLEGWLKLGAQEIDRLQMVAR